VGVDVPSDDIRLELLRTRLKSMALGQRASDERAARRGRFIEKLLRMANGPVYFYLKIQLQEGEELADLVTANEDEFILDYFLVDLDRLAEATMLPECQDALQDMSPNWRIMALARAADLQQHGARAPMPDPEGQSDAESLPPAPGEAEAERQGKDRTVNAPEQPATPAPAGRQASEGSETDPGRQAAGPAERAQAALTSAAQTTAQGSVQAETTAGRQDAAAATQAGASPPPVATVRTSLDEEAGEVLLAIGRGAYLTPPIFESAAEALGLALDDSGRKRLYKSLDDLVEAGLVRKEGLDLSIASYLLKRTGSLVVSLTEKGIAVYRDLCGKAPIDRVTPFVDKYKTAEAGVLVRLTRELIEGWNGRDDRRWTYDVVDAVWEPDEGFGRIPGAQRSYSTPDGKKGALPDLIVELVPDSGKSQVAVVEVERGGYDTADLWDKWERAALCYPPMTIYVVAPKARVRNKLYHEWKTVVRRVAERYGLPHGADAAFYTLAEVDEFGLLSARQFTSLGYLRGDLRKKQRDGEELTEEEKRILRMPRFWNQKGTPQGEQLGFG
jgi:hypothetical protein